jgi:ribonucleoside-diphosphate reductase subunit M2
MSDPLFIEDDRCAALPIRYPTIKACLEKQRGCFWQTHEVSLLKDSSDWETLSPDEKRFIEMVLAFFAMSDIIVNKNLTERFTREIKVHEVSMMYNMQKAMEDIHSEMYALLIDKYIDNTDRKQFLFDAVKNIPIVSKKAAWANSWMMSDRPYSHRVVAFSAIEGVFFSGAFCAIYWLKERGILPGLTLSNDFISRDEGLHVEGAVEIHKLLKEPIDVETLHSIIADAVKLEIEFITEALPCKLIGMNASNMAEYIRYVANRLVKQYGYPELYPKATQPFTFMDRIGLESKSNFFEKRPSEYNKLAAEVTNGVDPYADL